MEMIRVHSSSIDKVGYTPKYSDGAPAIFVVFKGSPKRTYVYGVPRKRAFYRLLGAESVGRHFNKYIQKCYPLIEILDK